ncbi:HU family DNA-binding protein [Rhodophyticola sp.]|jgi:nucleoid DNA-binding protein|uniref:HU family DNA-binding protein n=1 Tax=Rhodophyticola sp. TaxID=2680032 RepID=UPI003D2988D7
MATSSKPRKSTPAGRRRTKTARSAPKDATAAAMPAAETEAEAPVHNAAHKVTRGAASAADAEVAGAPPAAEPVAEVADAETGTGGTGSEKFKRGDLLAAVAARSAMKRSDLRIVVELVLEELGKALDSGKDLVVPPLGKVNVKRRNPARNGDVLVTRIKRHQSSPEGLAKPGEDG